MPPKREVSAAVRARMQHAAELFANGRVDGALSEYLAVLEIDPTDVLARQRAAELSVRLARPKAAIAHYRCLVGKYAAQGRLMKAIATCHRILEIDPAHAETIVTLVDLYSERDAPKSPVRMPSGMAPALKSSPSQPPPDIDPETLARIPLFSELAREPFESLLRTFERVVVPAGQTIVEDGQPGDALYAIAHGTVRVERRVGGSPPRVIAEMGEGEFFGEMSLLSRCPRFASVVSVTECELLRLGREALEQIVFAHPRVGEVIQRFYKERLVANVLRASGVFRELPSTSQTAVAELFRFDVHAKGAMLLEEGRPGGEGLFLLLRGTCDVFHRDDEGGERRLPSLAEGDVFGEVSLLQGGAATACVRASSSPCVVLGLHRGWVDELLLAHPPVRAAIYGLASQRLDRSRGMLVKDLADGKLV